MEDKGHTNHHGHGPRSIGHQSSHDHDSLGVVDAHGHNALGFRRFGIDDGHGQFFMSMSLKVALEAITSLPSDVDRL